MNGLSPQEMGLSEKDLGLKKVSLSGKDLGEQWPPILDPQTEASSYSVLYDAGDNRTEPPKNSHVSRLSYELNNENKRLRFFATWHQRDMQGVGDPNFKQYDILEQKFNNEPPQAVIVEGNISDIEDHINDPKYRIPSREVAIAKGEQAFMIYLVQQHNIAHPDNLVTIEGIDIPDTELSIQFKKLGHSEDEIADFFANRGKRGQDKMYFEEREVRDRYIIDKASKKFESSDKVDMVFGSGHAIREKGAWEEFFDTSQDVQNVQAA